MNKEVKQLVRNIEHIEGVEVRQTQNGHLAIYYHGKFITITGTTPSDSRWRENLMATLRQAGITPAVRPKGRPKEMRELLSVEELKKRVKSLPNRAEFARFLVNEMPKLQPQLRTFKNLSSAESSLHAMTKESYGLRGWTHLLLDQAVREWDARSLAQEAATNGGGAEEIVTEAVAELAEAHGIDREPLTAAARQAVERLLDVPPSAESPVYELPEQDLEPEPVPVMVELTGVGFADLARQHEELTERIDKLAEYVRTRQAQLDELVTSRAAVSEEILARLSRSEN